MTATEKRKLNDQLNRLGLTAARRSQGNYPCDFCPALIRVGDEYRRSGDLRAHSTCFANKIQERQAKAEGLKVVKLDPKLKAALELVCDLAKQNALLEGGQESEELEKQAQQQSDAIALVSHSLLS
jgi:hypothetical protein